MSNRGYLCWNADGRFGVYTSIMPFAMPFAMPVVTHVFVHTHALLRRCSPLALGLTLALASASTAYAEHGMPGYTFFPPDNMKLARNSRIFLLNSNGVAWSPASVRKARPALHSGKSRVPLRVVDRFDDMEGHARPFAEGEGYGSSMIVLQPTRTLAPATTYELRMNMPRYRGRPVRETVASWTTTARADWRKPVWIRGPAISSNRNGTAINIGVNDGQKPVLLEVRAREVGGRGAVRMLALIDSVWSAPGAAVKAGEKTHGEEEGEEGEEEEGEEEEGEEEEGGIESCSWVHVYDHEHGVIGDRAHRKTGRLYEFRIAAIDLAGNRRASGGKPVRMVWPDDGITICNTFASAPRHVDTKAPRWQRTPELALAPVHKPSSYLASYERYAPGWQIFTELVGETQPFYVIAELYPVRAKKKSRGARRPALRMMAKLHPPDPTSASGTDALDYGCTGFSYATGIDPDGAQPPIGARYRLRLAAIDQLGNRSVPTGQGIELTWTGVLPQLCSTARANPRPLAAADSLALRGPITLSNTGSGGRQVAAPYTAQDANVIDVPVVAQGQPYLVQVRATRVPDRKGDRKRARAGTARAPKRFVAWALLDPRQRHPRLQCSYADFAVIGRGNFAALDKNPATYNLSVSVRDLHGRTVRSKDAPVRATWSDTTQLAVCPTSPDGPDAAAAKAPAQNP